MSSYTGFNNDAPPAFRQGMSGGVRLIIYVMLSFALMGLDKRTDLGHYLRFAVRLALDPIAIALAWPGMTIRTLGQSWDTFRDTDASRRHIAQQQQLLSQQNQAIVPLRAENERLRALLELKNGKVFSSMLAADILSESIDAFSQRLILNKGLMHGIALGAPVIDARGLVGQIIEVYPLTSTVRTVSDRSFIIAVLNGRSQERGLAYGMAVNGSDIELRYALAHDVVEGDTYYTSGLDNIYPPHLAVGTVQKIDRRAGAAFARIALKAVAQFRQGQQVMVLKPLTSAPAPDSPALPPAAAKAQPAPRSAKPRNASTGALQ